MAGPIRLPLELTVWTGATAALATGDRMGLAIAFAATVVVSTVLMPERLARMIRTR